MRAPRRRGRESRLALLAGAQIGVGDALGGRDRERLRQRLRLLGVRTAASAPTLPLPLRSRKRANERAPASMRISERLPMPSARRAAMKARTSSGARRASADSVTRPSRCPDRKARNWRTSRS